MDKKITDIGEFGLIERIAGRLKFDKSVIKGIGDDCAVLKFNKDKYILFTTDILIEDVHFTLKGTSTSKDVRPFQIGWKALAVSISDIAAMGGIPKNALISLGLPCGCSLKMIDRIYEGMRKISRRFGINIVGGDTSKANKLIINISLMGEVRKKNLVLRSGARKGDIICVTGLLGGSIYGKHIKFIPRIKEAQILVKNFKLHSMIDISDGLSSDLNHIIQASNVGAVVYEKSIPLSKEAKSFQEALTMGEDFELLFTLSPQEAKRLLRAKPEGIRIALTQIGQIRDKKLGVRLITREGREKVFGEVGFRHF